MSAPRVNVVQTDVPPGRGSLAATGAWFVAGLTEKGPTDATACYSNGEFARVFGDLVSFSNLPNAVETYFAEGGSHVIVGRVVGPAAVAASKTIGKLVISASSVGDWGNSLKVAIVATEEGESVVSYVIQVTDSDGNLLEQSPTLESNADAVAWGEGAEYVSVASTGTELPTDTAATALSGGDDDQDGIGNSDWQAALDGFDADLGPGQVSTPGRSGEQAFADLIDHANARNRIAYLDVEETDDTAAELKAKATVARAQEGSEKGALFGPWVTIPGTAPGTTRNVPASATEAAKASRSDAETGNPNVPAAGDNGVSQYATGLVAEVTDAAERDELNDAGLNLLRVRNGDVVTYGFRTLANKISKPNDWQLANARLSMAVANDANAIGERHLFRQIDGNGIELARFQGDLEAMLDAYYKLGALFGATPAEAYSVNVGPDVNTTASLADGQLNAAVSIKRSPFAETVTIEIAAVHPTNAV